MQHVPVHASLRCGRCSAWQQVGAGARTTVVSSQGQSSVLENIVTVLGSRAAESMQPLEAAIPSGACLRGWAAPALCSPRPCFHFGQPLCCLILMSPVGSTPLHRQE